MDAATLKTIIDYLFGLFEERLAAKPFLLAMAQSLHALAVSLIPQILQLLPQQAHAAWSAAGAKPASLTKTVVDAIFAALEAALVAKPVMLWVVQLLHTLADSLVPALHERLAAAGQA